LKQAPRAWYQRFAAYIATMGFIASVTNTSLFVLRSGHNMAYLLSMLMTSSSPPRLCLFSSSFSIDSTVSLP
jgi:hypothetical protein